MIFSKFKQQADELFGNKYEYVETSLNRRFIEIICKKHGSFTKDIYSHLTGVGCNLCNVNTRRELLMGCVDSFLTTHKSVKFIKIEEVKKKSYMVFECSKGHVWRFTKGCETECYKCSMLRKREEKLQTLADENQVEVSIGDETVTIFCPEHGVVTESFGYFRRSKMCRACKKKLTNHKYTTDYFKQECKKLNTNYDYSKSTCSSCTDLVEIICKEHGSFFQKAYSHLAGHKCRKCSVVETHSSFSRAEVEIFELLGGVHGDRSLIYPKELDIYVKEHNLAVEYDGVYWHSTDDPDKMCEFRPKHVLKTEMCQLKDTKLLHIFENEWLDERTKHIWVGELLKRTQQIRPTKADSVELLSNYKTDEFLKLNSFQKAQNGISYGLFSAGVLFLVCQFIKDKSTNIYTMVKTENTNHKPTNEDILTILNSFETNYNPSKIMCEIDRRVEFLDDYLPLGFVLSSITEPKAYSVGKSGNLTELSYEEINTQRIIFDCGTVKMTR